MRAALNWRLGNLEPLGLPFGTPAGWHEDRFQRS